MNKMKVWLMLFFALPIVGTGTEKLRAAHVISATSVSVGPKPRAQELLAALARGDWSRAARFVHLDRTTRSRMGIASGAGRREARPKIEAWFKRMYGVVRPGRLVSVKIDARDSTRALVSYMHEDLDAFPMRYVNGDWYYVVD